MSSSVTGKSREKAIETAAELFSSKGFAATGVAEVIERSGTPKGSFYFNFPGGKEELGVEALSSAGADLEAGINLLADNSSSPEAFLRALTAAMVARLEVSDYFQGCPIATVALETATTSGPLREASDRQFAAWQEAIARGLASGERPRARERRIAGEVLMLLEGALLMARVRRSAEPLTSLNSTFRKLLT